MSRAFSLLASFGNALGEHFEARSWTRHLACLAESIGLTLLYLNAQYGPGHATTTSIIPADGPSKGRLPVSVKSREPWWHAAALLGNRQRPKH
eukprot:1259897-Amphidinium_carterae.1